MPRLSNEHLYNEISLVKKDVEGLKAGQEKIQDDLTMIKKQLLNPDDGAIARINKNTKILLKILGLENDQKSAHEIINGIINNNEKNSNKIN